MNFMGLGVSFGAKDDGLITALGGIETRLAGIQESLIGMNTLDGASAAAQGVVDSAGAMESGVAAAAEGFKSLGDDAMGSLLGIGDAADDVETDVGSGLFKTRHRLKLTGFGFISLGAIVSGLTAPIRAVTKLMGGLAQSFSPAGFDDGLKKLQEGVNLMNSMESELFSTGISARQMGAQFGYTGKALDQFESQSASMAYSLDVGVETAARAIRGFTEAESEMKAVGIESAADLARFSESFGVNADTLRNNLMAMRRAGGLSDEQIQRVTSSMVQMGQQTGDVGAALEQLPETMEMLRDQAALMGPDFKLSGDQLADFAVSTQAVAAGFFSVYQDSDKARSAASTISKALIESQTGFQNMFAGTADELDTFRQEMMILGLETDSAFNALEKGPQGFLQGMSEMYGSLKETGKLTKERSNFIRARLEAALGGEAASQMMGFFESADKGAIQLMSSVSTASESLGDLGKEAHKASFNLSDRMDRALQKVNTSLRRMSRSKTRGFIQDLQKDSKKLASRMKIAGERGNILGKVLGKIGEADQLGGLAFIPESLRSTAVLAGEASGALMKTWDAFKAGGGVIGIARNAIAMFATDMALTREAGESWGESFNRTANKFADIYAPMIEDAGDFVEEWIGKFANMDFAEMFGSNVDPDSAVGKIKKAFASIDWSGVWENLKKGIKNLWAVIKPQVMEFLGFLSSEMSKFWEAYGGPIKDAFWLGIIGLFSVAALMPILWGALTTMGSALMSFFGGLVMSALGSALSSIASWAVLTLLPTITSAFISVGGAILAALTAPVWAIIGIIAAVVATAAIIWYNFGDEISAFFSGMWREVKEIFGKIGTFFSELFGEKVTNVFLALGDSIGSLFDTIAGLAKTLIIGPFGKVFDFITGGGDDADDMTKGLDEATKAAEGLDTSFKNLNKHEQDSGRRRTPFQAGVVADPQLEAARKNQLAGMSEELQAIHNPMWWDGPGGYRDMFNQHMTRLTTAVKEQPGATAPTKPGKNITRAGRQPPGNTTVTPSRGG